MKQHPKNRLDEDRLTSFARSYLSESFPNPDRIGCPPEGALRRLAESPATADLSITEHLGCCSPCFQEYRQLLAEMKGKRRPITVFWDRLKSMPFVAIVGVLCLVVIAVSFAVWKSSKKEIAHHNPHPIKGNDAARYVPFVLDMRDAVIVRGSTENSHSLLKLRRMPLHVSVYLPMGSDSGQYTASLETDGKPIWAGTAAAQMQDHRMVLEFEDDLTSYPLGQYTLIFLSNHGMRLRQKVILEEPTKTNQPPH